MAGWEGGVGRRWCSRAGMIFVSRIVFGQTVRPTWSSQRVVIGAAGGASFRSSLDRDDRWDRGRKAAEAGGIFFSRRKLTKACVFSSQKPRKRPGLRRRD